MSSSSTESTPATQPVLIRGQWQASRASGSFQACNPATRQPLDEVYPVSSWADCDAALDAAVEAFEIMQRMPREQIACFLEAYAGRLEARADELAETAHAETALPVSPRLKDVELPRTANQLRQAAEAARDGSWTQLTIDTKSNIRSCLAPIGPVCVFGPNNFPLAFGSISGGDFVAAVAAGNPVIAKANSSHPATTRLLAEEAQRAADSADMPPGTIQLIYRLEHADGERLVADPRVAATGYTGSRSAGLKLKAAADAAGKPIYLELSSINPVVILPGAIEERLDEIADEFTTSCLMGTGQFCTNPGMVLLIAGDLAEALVRAVAERFDAAPVGTLLSGSVEQSLLAGFEVLQAAGAELVTGGGEGSGAGFSCANTLYRVAATEFLKRPEELQTEAFGNASLVVMADDMDQAAEVLAKSEGNLTGCFYTHSDGRDDEAYDRLAPILRHHVGRLLNDKMPTGVAVSPAMNHGGPYPSTGHAHFTAVGIPGALRRFSILQCFDNVRPHRLPDFLRDKNPNGRLWRLIDGQWTQGDVPE
jgi:alpha-ketoglutaric semialdehyde dehydrogenase